MQGGQALEVGDGVVDPAAFGERPGQGGEPLGNPGLAVVERGEGVGVVLEQVEQLGAQGQVLARVPGGRSPRRRQVQARPQIGGEQRFGEADGGLGVGLPASAVAVGGPVETLGRHPLRLGVVGRAHRGPGLVEFGGEPEAAAPAGGTVLVGLARRLQGDGGAHEVERAEGVLDEVVDQLDLDGLPAVRHHVDRRQRALRGRRHAAQQGRCAAGGHRRRVAPGAQQVLVPAPDGEDRLGVPGHLRMRIGPRARQVQGDGVGGAHSGDGGPGGAGSLDELDGVAVEEVDTQVLGYRLLRALHVVPAEAQFEVTAARGGRIREGDHGRSATISGFHGRSRSRARPAGW